MSTRDIACQNEILRGVVGSTAHGTAIDGQDDRDEMGVFVEPPEWVCGLNQYDRKLCLDHYVQRDQPEGARSQPGDLDLTMYSLRKFCRLAEAGNPSVVLLLWLPEYVICGPLGRGLVDMRQAFVSRSSGARFLGYLVAHRRKLTGERSKKVSRPELVGRYGYDTKFAMHALRLGYEGIELMTHRLLTLPVAEPNLSVLRAVRRGELTFDEVLARIRGAEEHLRVLVEACTWEADRARINDFMIRAHRVWWEQRGAGPV